MKLLFLVLNRSENEWTMGPREWVITKPQFRPLVRRTPRKGHGGLMFNPPPKHGIADSPDRLMDAITELHDGDVQMIDTSIVRVHQHGATAKRGVEIAVWVAPEAASPPRSRARRRPGPTDQAPAHRRRKERHRQCGRADRRSARRRHVAGGQGLRRQCAARSRAQQEGLGQHRPRPTGVTLSASRSTFTRRATRRALLQSHQAVPTLATRYDKLAENFLAAVKLASIRIWLRDL